MKNVIVHSSYINQINIFSFWQEVLKLHVTVVSQ